jgi:outer membrane protein OmpA-like peptidoglycan-associated protein
MLKRSRDGTGAAFYGAVSMLCLLGTERPAFSEEQISEQQIVRALTTYSRSRGLRIEAGDPKELEFIETVRNRTTRSLSLAERDKIAELATKKPSIDLAIEFEYNSAKLGDKALSAVHTLGKALVSPDIRGNTFIVAGHTDAKGSNEYNQKLSERRSEAVKRFLVQEYSIPTASLVSVGYGETRLKNTEAPAAAENRRVQVVNMADGKEAKR